MTCVDDLADVRTGDKGATLIVAVRARTQDGYELLHKHLTDQRMSAAFDSLVTGPVSRRVVPQVRALVFELPGVLGAGVTGTPLLDGHGKTLSYFVATIDIGKD